MKKTYITPVMLTVQLGTTKSMMQASIQIFQATGESDPQITNGNQILTKETSDVNLWDNEW